MSKGIKKSFINNSLIYLPSVLIPAFMNFLFIFVFTRIIGPDELGKYFLSLAVINFAAVIVGNWFQQSILRFESGEKKVDYNYLKIFHLTFLIVSGGLTILLFFAIKSFGGLLNGFYLLEEPLIYLVIVTEVWYRTILAILQSKILPKLYSLSTVLFSSLRLILSLLFYYFFNFHTYRSILCGFFFAQLIIIVFLLLKMQYIHFEYLKNLIILKRLKSYNRRLFKYTRYGIPMIGFMLATTGQPLIDRTIINFIAGEEAVGIYGSSYSIGTNVIGLLSMPLLLSAHPLLMGMANKKQFIRKEFVNTNFFFITIFTIFSGLMLIMVAPNSKLLASIVVGEAYIIGHFVITLSLFGSIINGLSIYIAKGLEVQKKTGLMLFFKTVSILVGGVSSFILIKKFGFIGASYGYIIGAIIYLLLSILSVNKYIAIKVPKILILSITSIAIIAIIARNILVDCNSILFALFSTIIGWAILGILIFFLKEINTELISFVRIIFVKLRSVLFNDINEKKVE